jgi:glycosyltransferase involved in cell wall biosynthesis
MKVLLVSPYHGGSHASWAEGYGRFSEHEIDILKLPDRFWKWRMHGGAVTLGRRFLEAGSQPDIILATDMLDLTTFISLTRSRIANTPVVLYMHENQLTYPLPVDKSTGPMRRQRGERDHHYAFINYASMLAADQIWFNSEYHLQSYFSALPHFLKHFPEYNELGSVTMLRQKSKVIPVGIDLQRLDGVAENQHTDTEPPLVLWNQRWEYDKNPEQFFAALNAMADEDIPFRVALCGQQYGKQPAVFIDWQKRMGDRVQHAGYATADIYKILLWAADVTISTAHHEFFGISILEAIYARTFPILPARLSYPDLIPLQYHQACLYEDFPGLLERLRSALLNTAEIRRLASDLTASAAAFDWRLLAPRYDSELAAAAKSFL